MWREPTYSLHESTEVFLRFESRHERHKFWLRRYFSVALGLVEDVGVEEQRCWNEWD